MEDLYLSFDQVEGLSKRDVDLQLEHDSLRPFYKYDVNKDSFGKVIVDKLKEKTDRPLLVKTLQRQAEKFELTESSKNNIISLLNNKTFTITTAHQPSFLTGPLYFVYKIFSAINLAEQLTVQYPEYRFVPLYVLGGEDHDFEEVNHVHLFGDKYSWDSGQSGSVGRMDIKNMKSELTTIFEKLGTSDNAVQVISWIENAFSANSNYSGFTLSLVNKIFGQYGLVCLSMDDIDLKREMNIIFRSELFNRSSREIVSGTQHKLNVIGYKSQVHTRDINLFYLRDGLRSRIVFEDDTFKVIKSDYVFSKNEMEKELNDHPDRFSPNVILRPLYQEKILPNLAYVGGGGELAYWNELIDLFSHHRVNFPMLVRRDSALLLDKNSQKLLNKTSKEVNDLFSPLEYHISNLINAEVDISLNEEKENLKSIFEQLVIKTISIDPSLKGLVESTSIKQLKSLDNISSKLKKSLKQKEEVRINQLTKLWNNIYPEGNLQERYDNFIPMYLLYGDKLFEILKAKLDPMDKRFKVLVME